MNDDFYQFSRDLAVAAELDTILQTIIDHGGQSFGRQAAVLLRGAGGSLSLMAASAGLDLSDVDRADAEERLRLPGAEPCAAQDVAEQQAGSINWLSLHTPRAGHLGVLGIASDGTAAFGSPEQCRRREIFASHAALAIERAQLAEHARRVEMLQATEKLQTALLHSISHDLRTPLLTITMALSNLEMAGERLDADARRAMARTGRQAAERLNRLVGNLLDLTRIEAGVLSVTEQPADVEEVIGAALDRLAPEADERPTGLGAVDERPVLVEIAADLPPVPLDEALLVQALVNVLDNAVNYSPEGSQLEIWARTAGEELLIQVADRGPGLREEDLPRIFDKFYRAQRSDAGGGSGLGLAVSRGIVEAHGGRMWAENRAGGGALISIALPLQRSPALGRLQERPPSGEG